MKTTKKICSLLLAACMSIASLPGAMAKSEASWINIEAETGDYPACYNLHSYANASGGKYIEVSGESYSSDTDATVDWAFNVDVAGEYDVWALVSSFAGATSVSQPCWGIDEAAKAGNSGSTITGAVYNYAYTNGFGGYSNDFVWAKIESKHNFTAGEHTIQYIPQLSTLFTSRLLAGIDTIRVVPSGWKWTASADLSEPSAPEPKAWIDVEGEDATYNVTNPDYVTLQSSTAASAGQYLKVFNHTEDVELNWSFEASKAGKYDVWVLAEELAASPIYFSVNGGSDVDFAGSTDKIFGTWFGNSADGKGLGWTGSAQWGKVASRAEITAGTNTLKCKFTTTRGDNARCGTVDIIRLVPSNWNWSPKANLDEPTTVDWIQVEAEDGDFTSKLSIATSGAAASGKYLTFGNSVASSNSELQSVTMKFEPVKSGKYDMWVMAGQAEANCVPWTLTMEGTEYTYPRQTGLPVYQQSFALGWPQYMSWHKLSSGVTLEADKEYTITASTHSQRGDNYFLNGIDCVRFVPVDYYWVPTADTKAPKKCILEPDRDGMVTIEAESGQVTGFSTYSHAKAGAGKYAGGFTRQTATSATSLSAFNIEREGSYDIWAAVATLDTLGPTYLGGYKFTYDGTDVLYDKDLGAVPNTNPDLYGEVFNLHSGAPAGAANARVRWVKIASAKDITTGTHTMLSEVRQGSGAANACGIIDRVVVVPTEWGWTAGSSISVGKGFTLRDESFAWVEGEDFKPKNSDAQAVSVGVAGGTPSGGQEIYRNARGSADASFAPEFTFDVYVEQAGTYEIWNYGYIYSTAAGSMHFGKMTASVNDNTTTGGCDYQVDLPNMGENGTDSQYKRWNKLQNNVTLNAGKNTVTVKYTYGGTHNLFCTDAVVVVPTGWTWRPGLINANDMAPMLDALSAYKRAAAQVTTGNVVEGDLLLADRGAAGSTITYESTNPAISKTGKVTVPTGWYGGTSTGSITAKATKGTKEATSDAISTVVNAVRPIAYDSMTFTGTFAAGETITAEFNGVRATGDDETAVAIVAVYKNGDMVSVKKSDGKVVTATAQKITADVTLPDDMSGVVVKGFLWTGVDTIIPISDTLAYGYDEAGYDDVLLPKLKAKYESKNISGFNMGLIADVQSPSLEGYTAYDHHYKSLVKASELIDMDCLADLGDMNMGHYRDKQASFNQLKNQTNILASSKLPVFRVKGNHEDNRWAVSDYKDPSLFISDSELVEACSADWENVMDGTTAGSQLYYYKDFEQDKIRVIALDTQNIPYNAEGMSSTYDFGFSQEQLNWLANEALDFSDKTDKEDWAVIFLMHALAYDNDANVLNFSGFSNIVSAFKSGTSGTYSKDSAKAPVTNVSFDFTSQGEMEVICIFNGHTHEDGDGTIFGLKYITLGSSLPDVTAKHPDRSLYTENEDLWDIATIDRANRKIYMTRFGAGQDREFSY